jgi:hypothetical protein
MANTVRWCTKADLIEAAMPSDRYWAKLTPLRVPVAGRTEELPHLSEENLQKHSAASDDEYSPHERAPSGPPSRASSYGSMDSGLSHPPGHRKRKKLVGLSFSQLERGKRLDSDSESNDEPEITACCFNPNCPSTHNHRKAVGEYFRRGMPIPDGVWLRSCSNHYARYYGISRSNISGPDAEKTRLNLVLKQLDKIVEWANSDVYPFIRDWGFRLRGWEPDMPNHLFEGPDQHWVSDYNWIPSWLMESQGKGMSYRYLRDILDRLQSDIDSGALKKLPNFVLEPNIIRKPSILDPPEAANSQDEGDWHFPPPPLPPPWLLPGPHLAYSPDDRGWTVRGPDLARPLITR